MVQRPTTTSLTKETLRQKLAISGHTQKPSVTNWQYDCN